MSSCAQCNQPVNTGCHCGFTKIGELSNPLVASLTPCVDAIRNLYTCLGARVYEVVVVKTRWSGGKRGVGVEQVISEDVILPTPQIGDLKALSSSTYAVGNAETGDLVVDQISPRYTEDFLSGREPNGKGLPPDVNIYWEIRIPGSERRRFTLSSAPSKTPLNFDWSVRLTKAFEDRARNGDPRG